MCHFLTGEKGNLAGQRPRKIKVFSACFSRAIHCNLYKQSTSYRNRARINGYGQFVSDHFFRTNGRDIGFGKTERPFIDHLTAYI